MKRLMMALGTLAMVFAACKPLVINGGGDGGGGGAPISGATGGSQAGTTPNAIAMRLGDAPPEVLPKEAPSSGAPTDPDTLVLLFSNDAQSCADPVPDPSSDCPSETLWQLILFIPPALQGSGPIDLTNQQVYIRATNQLPGSGSSAGCGAGEGEGPGTQGTLVIDSSNPDALAITLSGGVQSLSVTVDGSYTAAMCP